MIKVKNWDKFQHFKDRKPPWIKLYRDVLDDFEWHELDPMASKVLVMLWLIASENDGFLPDYRTLAFRLRMQEKAVISIVSKLSHWLGQDDIAVISGASDDIGVISASHHIGSSGDNSVKALTRSQETETETETETDNRRFAPLVFLKSKGVDEKLAGDWLTLRRAKKLPATETAIGGIEAEAVKAGMSLSQAITECCHRGWAGFKASWLDQKTGSEEAKLDWI